MARRPSTIRRILAGTVLIGLVSLLAYVVYLQFADQPLEAPEGFRKLEPGFYSQGIDVSHHQGTIDWETLLTSTDSLISFVFCKVTEGVTLVDQQWKNNRDALRKHKIPVGGYHFFKPDISAKDQASHFLKHCSPQQNDLPPVLDVEEEGTDDVKLRKNMLIWLETVEKKTGRRPIIYTNYYLFSTKFKLYFTEYNFWIANYSDETERLDDPRILYWQYTDQGKIPGISTSVDLNMSKIKF